ncbi:MAG: hypothetical protein EON93_14295 [Burkholderiales bacterium]|nr:MAG: hypothetical protein EON93_14295 [Burkholderiales bacterium]
MAREDVESGVRCESAACEGGGVMRGFETIGAVAERRTEGGVFALEAFGAFDGVAFVVVELCNEAFE